MDLSNIDICKLFKQINDIAHLKLYGKEFHMCAIRNPRSLLLNYFVRVNST